MATVDPGVERLVCVYYRIARRDGAHVMSAVRDFQRTLVDDPDAGTRVDARVLLRFELSGTPPTRDGPSEVAPDEETTVMETYRWTCPSSMRAGTPDEALRSFLSALDTAALAIVPLLRGARHVEVFTPCAS